MKASKKSNSNVELISNVVSWGAEGGIPVVHLHGTPSSCMERYPNNQMLIDFGIRFISLERDAKFPFWNPKMVAMELATLLSSMSIERFFLHSFSGGAHFSFLLAPYFGERVISIISLSGLSPLNRPSAFDGMFQENIKCFEAAKKGPLELDKYLISRDVGASLPLMELESISEAPELLEMLIENHNRTKNLGDMRIINEYVSIVKRSSFPNIKIPIHMWHGEDDILVPIHHSEYIKDMYPKSTLNRVRGAGHFGIWTSAAEILSSIRMQWRATL